jgi:hypothetical protein
MLSEAKHPVETPQSISNWITTGGLQKLTESVSDARLNGCDSTTNCPRRERSVNLYQERMQFHGAAGRPETPPESSLFGLDVSMGRFRC